MTLSRVLARQHRVRLRTGGDQDGCAPAASPSRPVATVCRSSASNACCESRARLRGRTGRSRPPRATGTRRTGRLPPVPSRLPRGSACSLANRSAAAGRRWSTPPQEFSRRRSRGSRPSRAATARSARMARAWARNSSAISRSSAVHADTDRRFAALGRRASRIARRNFSTCTT